MMWNYGGYGAIWMVIFWLGVALLIAWAIRGRDESESGKHAVEILEERFARGEIDHDEYNTRRTQLSR